MKFQFRHGSTMGSPAAAAEAAPLCATRDHPGDDHDLHGARTAWLAERVARLLGLDAIALQTVVEAANLHDIGKQFIDEAILFKPGRLDAEERRQMEMHVVFGAWTLTSAEHPQHMAAEVALLHHEWWNGQGYPFGLSGRAIPLAARITAVADVFDALSQARCYKPAWHRHDVMAYLDAQRGRQFDPQCADAMRQVATQLPDDWHLQALGERPIPARTRATVVSLLPRRAMQVAALPTTPLRHFA